MAIDLKRPENYSGVLNRIALFNFAVSLAAIHLLRWQIPAFDAVLSKLPETGEVMGVKLSVGSIVLAAVVAVISRAVKLHDRLSDLFRIRRDFDIHEILIPLALRSVGDLSNDAPSRIARHRQSLMRKVFYEFASSTQDRSVIDRHLILAALDQWSWFWCFLEGAAILLVSAIILLAVGSVTIAAILVGLIACCVGLLISMRSQCDKNASAQVEQILANSERRSKIAEVFRAL